MAPTMKYTDRPTKRSNIVQDVLCRYTVKQNGDGMRVTMMMVMMRRRMMMEEDDGGTEKLGREASEKSASSGRRPRPRTPRTTRRQNRWTDTTTNGNLPRTQSPEQNEWLARNAVEISRFTVRQAGRYSTSTVAEKGKSKYWLFPLRATPY